MNTRVCFWAIAVLLSSYSNASDQDVEPGANEALVEFHQRFVPELVPLGGRVHMAFGYEYSNFAFIEGDDGVIVIDAGWYPGRVQPAINDYRKITDKPVQAIIYTHVHADHTGGSKLFVNEAIDDVPIYADKAWLERFNYDASNLRTMVFRRAFSQMGIVLPEGIEGTVGAGVGPVVRAKGESHFVHPSVLVDEELEITISGVRMVLMHSAGDIDPHLIVWLPDDKVMFSGDTLGGTLPYIATPRFEPDRDPRKFMATIDKMMAYPVEYVAPGHGRALVGRADVLGVLQSNRDVIQFIADQVERYVLMDYTADQIIDVMELPPHLAAHPDLQPRYHRLAWIIRGLYMKHAGWVDETLALSRHTDSEEARRLIAMLGGRDKVLDQAQKALDADDPRWSASLASYVLRVDADNERALAIKVRAFKTIAYTSDSANERNYLLTAVKEMEDGIPWSRVFSRREMFEASALSSGELLATLSIRLKAEQVLEDEFSIGVSIDGEAGDHTLRVKRGILVYQRGRDENADAQLSLPRPALNRIGARTSSWAKELDTGAINVEHGQSIVKRFGELIE